MKSVLEYQDYRVYIQDYYDEMKRRNLLSWRIFAKQAGFTSSSYLKLVCQGKTTLSKAGIEQVGAAMDLKGLEMEYFRILVNFNQSKRADEKETYINQLENFVCKKKVELLGDPFFAYFTSWLNPVLHTLVPRISCSKPSDIARRLIPSVDIKEIKKSLRFLEKNGFLVKTPEGNYKLTEKQISSRSRDIASTTLRELHRQFSNLSIESLDNVPVDERFFSERIFRLSKEGYEKASQEYNEFIKKIREIEAQDQGIERLYAMNIQLFPITRKNTSIKKRNKPKQDKE